MTIPRSYTQVTTKQIVTRDTSMQPYVGFEHPTDTPDGWSYDIKRWCSPFDLRLPSLPRLSNPSVQGVSESTYFKSGVGAVDLGDLFVEDFEEVLEDGERHWYPEIRHGQYFRYRTDYFYYGDNSRVQYINPSDNRDNRNYLELNATPNIGSPILAATFKRNSVKENLYKTRVAQRYQFTGTYSGGTELETVSAVGKINWSNVDTTKKEFIVDHTIDGITRLWFNRNYVDTRGVVPTVYDDLAASDYLGVSTGSPYQVFYLPCFPVLADSTFHLYVATNTTWEEWTRVDTWWDLITTNWSYSNRNRYFLDKDLGIVYFGSANNGGIPVVGRHIVATYRTTLRVEYEELDRETKIIAIDADVNPVTQSVNQGFVCISHADIEPANITLSINKFRIQGTNPTEYGPILVGSDYAILKATVTSSSGVAVPNVEVSFEMTPSDLGYLAGASYTTAVTDVSGNAYTNYQPPTSSDTLGFYTKTVRDSTNPYYPTGREVIIKVSETGLQGKEDDIYLYQILKDDPILGYETIDEYLQALYHAEAPSWVQDATDYARWKAEMTAEYELEDWVDFPEGSEMNGRKVVVYEVNNNPKYSPYAINPIDGSFGAIVPLRPYLAEKIETAGDTYEGFWRLIYPNGAIPNCGPSSAYTIGGYWAVASKLVTFQASCWSPYYNRYIYSNSITARITLPQYLLGEYVSTLGDIPFGWKIIGDDDNIAAGLDGATFITINPHSGPYEVVDLVGGTGGTDTWAEAPFKTLSFGFSFADAWVASTSYSVGDHVLSVDGDLYRCTTAGTSGSSQPSWLDYSGATTTDNTVTWTRVGV